MGDRGCGVAWPWGELFQFPGVGEAVVLLGVNCFSSPVWAIEAVVLLGVNCFSSPGWARLWCCLG